MTTLRLWIDGGFPQRQNACSWWLHGDDGRLLQQGRSEARHWPGVGGAAPLECELLLAADNATWLATPLPAGRAPSAELLRYAVEDCLLDDAEGMHLVSGRRLPDGRCEVLAIARKRLDHLLASLRQIGLEPTRAVVAAQALLPAAANAPWPLLVIDAQAELIGPEGWLGVGADAVELAWLRTRGTALPGVQVLFAEPGAKLPDALVAALPGPSLEPRRLDVVALCRRGLNLLQGDYAPRRELGWGWRRLMPLLKLAGVAAFAWWLALVGDWLWQRQGAQADKAAITAAARGALPGQPLVAPLLQVQRALDARRHAQGELSDTDFLPLLARLAQIEGVRVDTLSFREGRLQARLEAVGAFDARAIVEQLRGDGYAVSLVPGEGRRFALSLGIGEAP